MTWTTFHRRGEVLRTVVAVANARRDGLLPLDVDGVDATFEDRLDLAAALQLTWHTRLSGHLERELTTQPLDLPLAVVAAWGTACDELPGVRLVLDRCRSEPDDDAMATAMAKATVKEHALLAVMAGQAGIADERAAAPIGARLEERARARHGGVPAVADAAPRPCFLERLRNALVA